ncbi:hypothetical protein ACWEV3_42885, partial [Saccharopolyspora sp. NPDC003752]
HTDASLPAGRVTFGVEAGLVVRFVAERQTASSRAWCLEGARRCRRCLRYISGIFGTFYGTFGDGATTTRTSGSSPAATPVT